MADILTDPSVKHVRDIMTTPVHTVDMDDSLLKVKQVFERIRCHHVVVLERDRVMGVVSDRDILRVVSPFVGNEMMERRQDLNTLKRRVHQVMSRDLVTIGADDTTEAATEIMLRDRVSCLPVVTEHLALLGIVTLRDLVGRAPMKVPKVEEDPRELEPDEGILVIVDGVRCYTPHVAIGRQIREADELFEQKHGAESSRARCLTGP